MKLLPAVGGALVAACLSASAASAATITRHYEFVASDFSGGPLAQVTGTFSLTFDPFVSSSGLLDALSVSHPGLTLTKANTAYSYSYGGVPQFSPLTIGGTVGGVSTVSTGASDFSLSFLGAGTDPLSVLPLNFTYSTGSGQSWSGTFQVSTYTPAAQVPEPGIWAMMIVGFGLAGAALRSRGREGGCVA